MRVFHSAAPVVRTASESYDFVTQRLSTTLVGDAAGASFSVRDEAGSFSGSVSGTPFGTALLSASLARLGSSATAGVSLAAAHDPCALALTVQSDVAAWAPQTRLRLPLSHSTWLAGSLSAAESGVALGLGALASLTATLPHKASRPTLAARLDAEVLPATSVGVALRTSPGLLASLSLAHERPVGALEGWFARGEVQVARGSRPQLVSLQVGRRFHVSRDER